MLGAASRAFLTVLLVAVMAGTAVAFAVGVNFSPRKTVCINTGIPGYAPICVQTKPVNVSNVQLNGLGKILSRQGHIHLTFKNNNTVPVQVTVVLVIKDASGKIHRITTTFSVAPGHKFSLTRFLKGIKIRGAKLTLTITDSNGDKATITRTTGKFKTRGKQSQGNGNACKNRVVQGTLVTFCH